MGILLDKTKNISPRIEDPADLSRILIGKGNRSIGSRQDAKVLVHLPLANALIFALLITEIAKAFEKFAFANFLEESNYKT